MAYNPHTWVDGETITTAKLNTIENGIANAGGVLKVTLSSSGVLDKTWQEIYDAGFAVLDNNGDISVLNSISAYSGEYMVVFSRSSSLSEFSTDSANGYPESTSSGGSTK